MSWFVYALWLAALLALSGGATSVWLKQGRLRADDSADGADPDDAEQEGEVVLAEGATIAEAFANMRSRMFGGFADPSMIPDHARSCKWESAHLFTPYAKRPTREFWGLQCPEPPLAMACPECDLRQPVLQAGTLRRCTYCGSNLMTHGTRLFWWPSQDVTVEWRPSR